MRDHEPNDQILAVAHQVDDALIQWCTQAALGPLALSGIILARLTHLNDMCNQGPDWRKLCEYIQGTPVRPSDQYDHPVSDLTQAQQILQRYQKGS